MQNTENVVPLDREAKAEESRAGSKTPNPFLDLDSIRLDQSYADGITTKKLVTKVRVGKPDKHQFARVNPNPAYRLAVPVIEDKDAREFYLVTSKELVAELGPVVARVMLFTAMTRAGTTFLWLVRLPDADGNHNSWHASNLIAAEHAESAWVKLEANHDAKAYDVVVAEGDLPAPTWCEMPFAELVTIAFRGKTIDSYDHPLLRRMRGAL